MGAGQHHRCGVAVAMVRPYGTNFLLRRLRW
jgi:hypothetical protein